MKVCLFIFIFLLIPVGGLHASDQCIFVTKEGAFKVANSEDEIPNEYKKSARCFKKEDSNRLAAPEELELTGALRREEINSSIGKMKLRWPRSAERLFGRTPVRALTDAARTVSRVVRSSVFPTHLQNIDLPWNIVFMDEELPEGQIPANLISNCHPGWMTPPANIYIVAQRVSEGCNNQKLSIANADRALTEVLIHEMAHALEFHILPNQTFPDRMRAEGFATWFEMYASHYSSLINQKEITKRTAALANTSFLLSPDSFAFSGSGEDYARAAMFFSVIEDTFGARGVFNLYQDMNQEGLDFFGASKKKFSLDPVELNKRAQNLIKKNL